MVKFSKTAKTIPSTPPASDNETTPLFDRVSDNKSGSDSKKAPRETKDLKTDLKTKETASNAKITSSKKGLFEGLWVGLMLLGLIVGLVGGVLLGQPFLILGIVIGFIGVGFGLIGVGLNDGQMSSRANYKMF